MRLVNILTIGLETDFEFITELLEKKRNNNDNNNKNTNLCTVMNFTATQ